MSTTDNDRDQWFDVLRQQTVASDKKWWVTFWLTFWFGFLGAGRFYLGYAGLGFLQMFSLGGLGLLVLYDHILLFSGKMKDADGRLVKRPWGK